MHISRNSSYNSFQVGWRLRLAAPAKLWYTRKWAGIPSFVSAHSVFSTDFQHVDKHNTCIYSMIWSYTCIYMHIQYDMNIYIHIQVNIYSYIMIQTNTYRYMHIQAYTWWSVSGVNRTSTRGIVMPQGIIHTYIYWYIHIYTDTYIYILIQTHTGRYRIRQIHMYRQYTIQTHTCKYNFVICVCMMPICHFGKNSVFNEIQARYMQIHAHTCTYMQIQIEIFACIGVIFRVYICMYDVYICSYVHILHVFSAA